MDIPVLKPYFSKKEIARLKEDLAKILTSRRFILGPYSLAFEEKFAHLIQSKFAVAINTCTSALMACLNYYKVEGKEVIVPANAFISDPNVVLYEKGTPVFCEVDPKTLSLDPRDLEKRITKKTRAVIVVHIGGLITPDIYEIKKICEKNDLILIEDCAHSLGATLNGTAAGAFGHASCFSFYPTKVITTMVGGMVVTDDEGLMRHVKSIRFFGSDANDLFKIVNFGNDWLLDEFRCALGLSQLRQLDEIIKKKGRIAAYYDKRLKNMQGVTLMEQPANSVNPYYRYITYLDEGIDRDALVRIFKEKHHIQLSRVYVPCHLHPVYKNNFGYKENDFPITEKALTRSLTLPIYPEMTLRQASVVVSALKEELGSLRASRRTS